MTENNNKNDKSYSKKFFGVAITALVVLVAFASLQGRIGEQSKILALVAAPFLMYLFYRIVRKL